MGRSTALTDQQKGSILALSHEMVPARQIASFIGKSNTTVHNFLAAQGVAKTPKKMGRPNELSSTQLRALFRHASTGNYTARQLQTNLDLSVSVRRVQQLLSSSGHMVYKKMKSVPALTEDHKKARYEWAKDHVTWPLNDWKYVIFSDGKKLNMDGPDGFAHYWHDLRKEPRYFSTRQQGGQSVMVWGAIAYDGTSNLVFISEKQDSKVYCNVLEEGLLPFAEDTVGDTFIFQQDNAATHRSNYTKDWLDANDVYTMPWPAKSPDQNPIENMWGILARAVYCNQRQFTCIQDLEETIIDCWYDIASDVRKRLFESMQRRCVAVIEKKGGPTRY